MLLCKGILVNNLYISNIPFGLFSAIKLFLNFEKIYPHYKIKICFETRVFIGCVVERPKRNKKKLI